LAVLESLLQQDVPERVEVIIPARALREAVRLIGEEDEPLEMAFNAGRSQVLFRMKTVELVATLIQGTFPNYSQLIPQSFTTKATIGLDQFRQETRIAGILARDGVRSCASRWSLRRTETRAYDHLRPRRGDRRDHRGEMDVKIEGEASKIAFSQQIPQDVLGVLDTETVALETTSPSSPGVIRPLGTNDVYEHVVMPMFVQW
jgi:DNA polymerase-3 subunit beta